VANRGEIILSWLPSGTIPRFTGELHAKFSATGNTELGTFLLGARNSGKRKKLVPKNGLKPLNSNGEKGKRNARKQVA